MNKKILGLLVSAVLAGSPAAQAAFVPVGPQNDVTVATVTGWGWSVCYSASYATPLGQSADAALANCNGDLLMLAARRAGSSIYEVLAAAPRADVLFNTGINGNVTHAANGSEWYYAGPNWSWGFAGAGDAVAKNECDVAGGNERDRLCWHTFANVGGYRAGAFLGLNSSTEWQKEILVANAVPAPEPGSLALLGLGLAGLGLSRRRKES